MIKYLTHWFCKGCSPDPEAYTRILRQGNNILGYVGPEKQAKEVFQELIDADVLEHVRFVDPQSGDLKELYYAHFPVSGWVNELGSMVYGGGYLIKLKAPHKGFKF